MTATAGLLAYQFTFPEMAWIASCPEKPIRLWVDRGHVGIGQPRMWGLRHGYSLADAITVATVRHLAVCKLLELSDAGTVAALVAKMAGDPPPAGGGSRMLMIGFDMDGHPCHFLNTAENVQRDFAPLLRRPCLMVPVDHLTADVLARAEELRQREAGRGSPAGGLA